MNINRNALIVIVFFLTICLLLSGCGLEQMSGSAMTATPDILVGKFHCTIPFVLQGNTNTVILGFTITPEQKIGSWSIFDLGTRSVSIGNAIGESSLTGNLVTFALTDPSGTKITYKIDGTIESMHKMTGEYSFDYGSRYGVATGKFDCNPTPPTAEPTDNSGVSSSSTPTRLPAKTPTIASSSYSPAATFLSNKSVGNCKWDVSISLSGFAPNSKITVSSKYKELVCASGKNISDSWSDAYPEKTDKNGNLTIIYLNEGTGDYTYTFVDSVGNKASVSFTAKP